MKIVALIALLIMSTAANAQNMPVRYTTSRDSINGNIVYKGLITFDDLRDDTATGWFKRGTKVYIPRKRYVKKLNPALHSYTMVVVMGTWCGDSKDLVPKLYNVLGAAKYPMANATVYGLGRDKIIGNGAEKTYNITRVPTIILFDGTKEIGRITESVDKNMEADLAAILKQYKKN